MNEENVKEKVKKPKGRILFSVLIMLFCGLLIFFSLYGFFVPDREMSENENRVLAKMPAFTVQGLFDGSFMKDFESYLTDQFPFRDEAVYIKSFTERLWGKTEENGAYIGKDGFLFDGQTSYDEERMAAVAKSVSAFAKKNKKLKTVFALVPNSTYIYSEKLPENLELPNQKKQIADFYGKLGKYVSTIDAVSTLLREKSNHQVFYRTDHHWTTRGAYSVFKEIMNSYGFKPKDKNFKFYTVSNSFEGTLKAKCTSQNSVDSVEICSPKKSAGTFFIEFSGKSKKRSGFYFEDKLEGKNHYEVFLGGNYAKLTVTTKVEEGRKLLVIKDSFANCLLPMLTPYFSKIVVVDPRYMTESVQKVMQDDDFTDILFLYNANTFFADTSLTDVLAG